MNLKTLDDIIKKTHPDQLPIELRKEAKKWIKELENVTERKNFCLDCGHKGYGYRCKECNSENVLWNGYEESDIEGAIKVLKHICNISEGKLK